VRCVYEIAQAVAVPIVGTGGVRSGEDALQMIMAGATCVGVGSALYNEGAAVFGRIASELRALLAAEGLASASAARGLAHV